MINDSNDHIYNTPILDKQLEEEQLRPYCGYRTGGTSAGSKWVYKGSYELEVYQ